MWRCRDQRRELLPRFEMPFGGYKYSGIGTEGVMSTFDEVTHTKTVVLKGIDRVAAAEEYGNGPASLGAGRLVRSRSRRWRTVCAAAEAATGDLASLRGTVTMRRERCRAALITSAATMSMRSSVSSKPCRLR